MSYFSEPDQRKWQTVFVGQAVVQIKGDRSQSSDLLTDGANAGHSSRVSTATTFSIPGM